MAIITQFQTDPLLDELLDRHHAWHTPGGMHGFPSRQYPKGTPNSGREFLHFHHDTVTQFLAWNTMHGNLVDPALLAAWTAIPTALKVPQTGWPNFNGGNLADNERRVTTNNPRFADDDELGIFIETQIHDWIHGAVGVIHPDDPFISGFHSPQSTYFYQIHGMVDIWWNRFLHPKTQLKDVIDSKGHRKEFIHDKQLKEFVREKIKDIIENVNLIEKGDPAPEILKLQARIKVLEDVIQQGKPFIKSEERPEVGKKRTQR